MTPLMPLSSNSLFCCSNCKVTLALLASYFSFIFSRRDHSLSHPDWYVSLNHEFFVYYLCSSCIGTFRPRAYDSKGRIGPSISKTSSLWVCDSVSRSFVLLTQFIYLSLLYNPTVRLWYKVEPDGSLGFLFIGKFGFSSELNEILI